MSRFGLFRNPGVAYAIPLQRLLKILSGECCYLLPKLPNTIAGVVVWNEQLIPQLNLVRLLGGSPEVSEQADYLVLVTSECGILALPANKTCGIVAEQAGELITATERKAPGIAGEFYFQETVFKILDIDSLAIDLTQEAW